MKIPFLDKLAEKRRMQAETEGFQGVGQNFNVPGPTHPVLIIIKYAFFGLFAFLNFNLFTHTVPGVLGWIIGIIAVSTEAAALYCWAVYPRSAGSHRKAILAFGVGFTLFSFVHAVISYYAFAAKHELLWMREYSIWVAFPTMCVGLILCPIVLPALHHIRKVANEQARAQAEIETDHARVAAESAKLAHDSALQRARLRHFEQEMETGLEMVKAAERAKVVRDRARQLVESTADPDERAELAEMLGISASASLPPPKAAPQSSEEIANAMVQRARESGRIGRQWPAEEYHATKPEGKKSH